MNKISKFILNIFAFILFLLSGLSGIFASAGICTFIWGAEFFEKQQTLQAIPALLTFMVLFIPLMTIGFIGGLFLFVIPLTSHFGLSIKSHQSNIEICKSYRRMLDKIIKNNS